MYKDGMIIRLTPAVLRHLDFPEAGWAMAENQRVKVYRCQGGNGWKVANSWLKQLARAIAKKQSKGRAKLRAYASSKAAQLKRNPRSGVPLPTTYLRGARQSKRRLRANG